MDWIATLDREAALLSAAARHDPAAPVVTCPGWDVDDLLRHVGSCYRLVEVLVREGRTEAPDAASFQAPTGPSLDHFEANRAAMVETLRHADPAQPVWSWTDDRTVGFWMRRMVHETVVHRVDAELATGQRSPVDPALAADGVEEALTLFLPRRWARSDEPGGPTLHLHATDVDGEWLVRFGDRSVTVEHGHAKGDAAVRGPAGDLLLWLWGRAGLDELEVFGDAGVAARLDRARALPGEAGR